MCYTYRIVACSYHWHALVRRPVVFCSPPISLSPVCGVFVLLGLRRRRHRTDLRDSSSVSCECPLCRSSVSRCSDRPLRLHSRSPPNTASTTKYSYNTCRFIKFHYNDLLPTCCELVGRVAKKSVTSWLQVGNFPDYGELRRNVCNVCPLYRCSDRLPLRYLSPPNTANTTKA